MNHKHTAFVGVNKKTGNLMGIDYDSGGYPWDGYKNTIHGLHNIYFFTDEADADDYIKMFPEYVKAKIEITLHIEQY